MSRVLEHDLHIFGLGGITGKRLLQKITKEKVDLKKSACSCHESIILSKIGDFPFWLPGLLIAKHLSWFACFHSQKCIYSIFNRKMSVSY